MTGNLNEVGTRNVDVLKNNEKQGVLVNFNTDNLDYNGSYESDLAKLT